MYVIEDNEEDLAIFFHGLRDAEQRYSFGCRIMQQYFCVTQNFVTLSNCCIFVFILWESASDHYQVCIDSRKNPKKVYFSVPLPQCTNKQLVSVYLSVNRLLYRSILRCTWARESENETESRFRRKYSSCVDQWSHIYSHAITEKKNRKKTREKRRRYFKFWSIEEIFSFATIRCFFVFCFCFFPFG